MRIDLESAITEVTVYSHGGQVTRQGRITVDAPGEHSLCFLGLPMALDTGSFRATGSGPAGARILSVESAQEYHATAPEEALTRLRDEIEQLERAILLLDERNGLLAKQEQWLTTLGEQSARSLAWGMARGTAKPSDASGLLAYTDEESQRIAAARQEILRQRAETQRTLDARRRELAHLSGAQQPDRLTAVVRIETVSAGEVTVDLSYLVYAASWTPRYDARVDAGAAKVLLTQQALVTQRTGEDWHQVALSLSTARPSATVRLPDEPDPWYLDVYQPMPPPVPQAMRRMRQPMTFGAAADAAAPMAASVAEMELHEEEMKMAAADVEQSGAAQIFHIGGWSDVPSDGLPHTLGIGAYDLPCRLEYIAEPVISEGAHLRAMPKNTSGTVLLPGEMYVFHAGAAGDEYVGATRLELTAQDAELTLYLGIDDNVTVKRELIERDTDKGNILQTGVRRVTVGYRVTLANRTSASQYVILKDRMPVPRHERIKIRPLDFRPQPTSKTKLEQLTWDMQLAPGEERKIEWRFTIEAPADL
ncbi:MAG TPA: mucoidy inhibitor MuiA family protein, partial [Ktedonobacterales bacterium]|nr:mucoidy inhibitor MuiA family protein [Ktedonobacterales bacterium]